MCTKCDHAIGLRSLVYISTRSEGLVQSRGGGKQYIMFWTENLYNL